MSQQHTPTPWAQHSKDGLHIISTVALTKDRLNPTERPVTVAKVWGPSGPLDVVMPEHLANAAYIVQACNAFPALVEALRLTDERDRLGERLRSELEHDLTPSDASERLEGVTAKLKEVRAALKQAGIQ